MFTRNRLCVVLSVVALLALGAACAQAASITVNNYSFEDPVLADGGYVAGPPPSWSEYIPGAGLAGFVFNPGADVYTGAAGNGTPLGADGPNTFDAGGSMHYCWQETSAVITEGTTYTLTVAVGEWATASTGWGDLWLVYGDTTLDISKVLVSYSTYTNGGGYILTPGEFKDYSISYTAKAGDAGLGHHLQILVGGFSGSGLDNVRLTATTIPEPATLILLATGLIGLVCYAWRKRK